MAKSNDPNAREHRNFALDGEHSPPVEPYPGAGYTVEADRDAEYQRLEQVRQQTLGGDPDFQLGEYNNPMPSQSPGMLEREAEQSAQARACQGGLPDAPAPIPHGRKPFKGMR